MHGKCFKRIACFALIAVTLLCICVLPACGGNDASFKAENCQKTENALTGKTFYWLGSSVTLGMESGDEAVADYIAARNGSVCVKEAVSGTTLIDEPYKKFFSSYDSYVTRLKNTTAFDKSKKIDAFFCQISTNDAKASFADKRGTVTADDKTKQTDFDVKTSIGAMEYVIAYVRDTWNCPIYFFSGSYFADEGDRSCKDPKGSDYASLIKDTYKVAEKWNKQDGVQVKIIDLFNDEAFNEISDEDYALYMHDPIHPFKAGYLKWWTPAFEKILLEDFGSEVQG